MLNCSKKKLLKVGIVDDSILIRQMLNTVICETSDMTVVGMAKDAHEARAMIKQVNPDVITLDIEMPHMNGLDFLEKIMLLRPMPVIMVSTLTQKGADATLRALEIGALDYVAKPSKIASSNNLLYTFQKELIPKLNLARFSNLHHQAPMPLGTHKNKLRTADISKYSLICIASSTGGIERLRYIFSNITISLPPVVIVQHINKKYVDRMVDRFKQIVPPHISVAKTKDGQELKKNTLYFAGNMHHVRVIGHPKGVLRFIHTDEPALNGFKASADYMFESVSELGLKNILGLIISGMGNDGAKGLQLLRSCGYETIGENEASSLIYGMPKAAKDVGAISKELSIQDITHHLNAQILRGKIHDADLLY